MASGTTFSIQRVGPAVLLASILALAPTTAASSIVSQTAECRDSAPTFTGETLKLHDWIGKAMGDAGSCPYQDPTDTDRTEQLTIHGFEGLDGLVYSRPGATTFTINLQGDQEHWALLDTGLIYWDGPSVDPPPDAIPVGGCKAVLDAYTAGGAFQSGFVWNGIAGSLGRFDNTVVTVCVSSETFAGGNTIQCLLANDQPVPINGGDACDGFLSLTRTDDRTVLGRSNLGSTLDRITVLRWTGSGFQIADVFDTCKGTPPVRVLSLYPASGALFGALVVAVAPASCAR